MLENPYAIHKEKEVNPIGIWIRVFSRMSDYWTNLVAYYPLMAVFAWEKDDKPWDLGGYPIVTFSDKTNWWTIHNLMFLGRASKASYVQKQISLFG